MEKLKELWLEPRFKILVAVISIAISYFLGPIGIIAGLTICGIVLYLVIKKQPLNSENKSKMTILALIGVILFMVGVAGTANSSSSKTSSKAPEKSEPQIKHIPLRVPDSVVADKSCKVAISGKTAPKARVQISDEYDADEISTNADKDGNFTLNYEIEKANNEETINIISKSKDAQADKKVLVKQNPDIIKQNEAEEKAAEESQAKADAEAKAKQDAEAKAEAAKEKAEADARAKEQAEADAKAKAEADEKAKEDAQPIEYKNALTKAESYSTMMNMSKAKIYDQLTSEYGEHFSAEAAQYAVDTLKADYNKNALEKAKSYQSEMTMSKDRIYEQLTSDYGEMFTAEEAQYAVNNLPA